MSQRGDQAPAENAPKVVPYDLTSPQRLRPGEMAQLRALGSALARALARLLSEYLGCRVGVEFEGVMQRSVGASGYAGTPRAWVVPTGLDELHAPRWSFSWPLASALVDLMLGTRPHPAPEPGSLTRAEAVLISHLCEELHEAWAAAWPLKIVSPGPWRCLHQLAPPLPDAGATITLSYQVCVPDLDLPDPDAVRCCIHLPLELARLPGAQGVVTQSRHPVSANPIVCTAPVQIQVALARWRTTLRHLLSLKPGEVITLPVRPDEDLPLSIAGTAKMRVKAGTHHGRIAVQVVSTRLDERSGLCTGAGGASDEWQALYGAEGE